MLPPEPQHFPKFLDFSPDDVNFKCICPLSSAHFRRCGNPVNKEDCQSALALREEIRARDPFGDGLDECLQRYAQLCCCVRYHRAQLNDAAILNQLCDRWKKQLRSAHTATSQETLLSAETAADHIEVVVEEASSQFKSSLPRNATTSKKAPRRAQPGAAPDTGDHVKVAKETGPPGPKDSHRSSSRSAVSQDDSRTPDARPRKTDTSPSNPPQPQAAPTAPAEVLLRRIITRSQTGSLAWAFTPRRPPAENTMLKLLTDPISEYSSQYGIIYLYTRASDPGYIKLGCTTRTAKVRMGEWEKSCGYKPIVLYTTGSVPNVRRLESLLKKELNLRGRGREERFCKHNKYCDKNHKEWFQISTAEAILLVDTWVAWMCDASPYRGIANANGRIPPAAVLRDEWSRHFMSLSQKYIQIRSHCLEMRVSTPKVVAVTHDEGTSLHESEVEDAEPEEHVSEPKAVRRPLAPISTNTASRADSLAPDRRSRGGSTEDKAGQRSDRSQLVDNGSLDPKIAAAFALAASALCQSFGIDDAALSAVLKTGGSLADSPSGVGGANVHSSALAKKPVRQILAC